MAVTIGIQTYNRKDLLQVMAASLYESSLSTTAHIRIYDDKSTDYGVEELREIFPTAVTINRNETNLKADKNMYNMYYNFIHNTQDEYFFNADSDMIFKTNWLEKSMALIKKTNGILSLFNTSMHKAHEEFNDELVLKKTVGAAGVLFSRKRLEELMTYFDSMEMVKAFDWQWSEYFTGNNISIFCVKESLVQHIGYRGQNAAYFFAFGKDYKIETIKDGQIINDIFEKYAAKVWELEKEREDNFVYHIKRCFIIVLKKILPETTRNHIKEGIERLKSSNA
ncbi:MAG: glycosyltransferase family 2 protein [Spirochaetaceae bacterium]|jgi:hypothetical protein|nr:glycosyltransferase family 2 protein [Spirochaetaceae bacterium]